MTNEIIFLQPDYLNEQDDEFDEEKIISEITDIIFVHSYCDIVEAEEIAEKICDYLTTEGLF